MHLEASSFDRAFWGKPAPRMVPAQSGRENCKNMPSLAVTRRYASRKPQHVLCPHVEASSLTIPCRRTCEASGRCVELKNYLEASFPPTAMKGRHLGNLVMRSTRMWKSRHSLYPRWKLLRRRTPVSQERNKNYAFDALATNSLYLRVMESLTRALNSSKPIPSSIFRKMRTLSSAWLALHDLTSLNLSPCTLR